MSEERRQRLESALRSAHERAQQGDEQAQEHARRITREIRSLDGQGSGRGITAPVATVNEGIARGFDGMAGPLNRAVNFGLRGAFGENALQLSETPTRDAFSALNVDTAEPESLAGQFGMGAGEAASYMIPFAGAANALSRGSGLAAGAAQRLMDPLVRTPVTALSSEMAAGGGVRVAGELAENAAPDNALARTGAELAGGLAGGMTPYGITHGPGATALRGAGRVIGREIFPFTERGARTIAGDRLRALSADPDAAVNRLNEETIASLTPAQRTGEPGVMALERSIADRDPRISQALDGQVDGSRQALQTSARELGEDPSVARQYFEGQIENAREAASRRLSMIEPERRPGANAAIVREELDNAFSAAKQGENEVWSEVPRMVQVPTQRLRQTFDDILENTPRAKADEIPQLARQMLGDEGFSANEPVSEVYGMYSRLGQMAREEAAKPAPNRSVIANLTRMRQAILDDLGAVGDPQSEVGMAINRARDYSRQLNDTFESGTVGRLLGSTRQGGDRVDPNLTLEAALGGGGTRGAVGAREITDAAGFGGDGGRLQTTQGAAEDFLRGRFVDRAARDGQINPDRARDFMQRERETLDQFPSLAQQFSGAEQAARSAADLDASPAGAFTRTRPGEEVARTVFGRNVTDPQEAARSLYRQAAADETGQAVRGLKGGAVDYVMGAATTGPRGDPSISGTAMRNTIRDNRGTLSEILSDDEIMRLDRIAHEFALIDDAQSAGRLSEIIDQKPNAVVSYLARVVAARQGAQAGAGTSGASLQAAGMASNRMRDLMQRLTGDRAEALLRDAVQDPQLMRSLFDEISTPAQQDRVAGRLSEWLQGYTATQATDALSE